VTQPASLEAKDACRDVVPPGFRAELGTLDFTLLVIGAIVGADVYIVAGMGAQFLGPAQLVAWLAAGALGALIALAFVQCAAIDSEVGGPYAYVRRAFGPMAGLVAGWALYLGEGVALPIFPLTFGNYLVALVPGLPVSGRLTAGVLLVVGITAINVFGTRATGRLNDVLSAAKLVPLLLLIAAGLFVDVTHPAFWPAASYPILLRWAGAASGRR
jgi:amino acid transporter